MNRFNINDKVKILAKNTFWNGKIATVLSDLEDDDIENNIDYTNVKVSFYLDSGKKIIQTFPRYKLKLTNEGKNISESSAEPVTDIIAKYVYFYDLNDNKVASWIFTSKLATAEEMSEEAVIALAKKLKYKIFLIKGNNFSKTLIAASEITADDIFKDYAGYILGKATIEEI